MASRSMAMNNVPRNRSGPSMLTRCVEHGTQVDFRKSGIKFFRQHARLPGQSMNNRIATDSVNEDQVFATQRLILGVIAVVCLAYAAFCFFTDAAYLTSVTMAMSLRIGLLLGVVWLALPQLRPIQHRLPAIVLAAMLGLLVLLAARPNLFKVVGSLIVIITVLAGIAKWFKRFEQK